MSSSGRRRTSRPRTPRLRSSRGRCRPCRSVLTPGVSEPAYLRPGGPRDRRGKRSCSGASGPPRTWTSLPTNTPAFASTVARRESHHRLGVMKMPRQSAAAPTSSTVSRGSPVIRWNGEVGNRGVDPRPATPSAGGPRRRSGRRAWRSRATKSTGNTSSSALGRRMSSRVSSISAPPALRRENTSSAPAIPSISHGTHARRASSEWTSKVRMNETPETTPKTTRPAAPAATAHVIETDRADGGRRRRRPERGDQP